MNGRYLSDDKYSDEYKLTVEAAGKYRRKRGPNPEDECFYCGKKGHWYILMHFLYLEIIIF